MIRKTFLIVGTTALISIGGLVSAPETYANTDAKISEVEERLSETRKEIADLEKEAKRVDKAIEANDKLIKETEKDIKARQASIDENEKEIEKINDNIDRRTDILKNRVLSLQEAGGSIGYVEVLMGSKDFSDFVDRVFAIVQMTNNDTELIEEQENDKILVGHKQLSLNNKLESLEETMLDLEDMKAVTLKQKEENDKLKKDLKKLEKSDVDKRESLLEERRRAQEAEAAAAAEATRQTQVSRGGNNNSTSNTPPAVSYNGDISSAITAGYKYIGRSTYKFGGGRSAYDIANGLFDCSGFVSWSFRQAGISLPASTDGLKHVGTRVSTSEMRPGDLVFFNTYKTDGHVGIYLGNGQFIGSQTSTGVAVASMSSGYWKNTFNGRVNRIN